MIVCPFCDGLIVDGRCDCTARLEAACQPEPPAYICPYCGGGAGLRRCHTCGRCTSCGALMHGVGPCPCRVPHTHGGDYLRAWADPLEEYRGRPLPELFAEVEQEKSRHDDEHAEIARRDRRAFGRTD